MRISMRGWSVVVLVFAVLAAVAIAGRLPAADGPAPKAGQLTEKSLGNLIEAMGLDAKKEQQRYDFSFKAKHQGAEWELSMSAVLSQNGEAIWVMAWLDELPKSASDVSRQSLLRLLALNDTMGQGKFFAYISSNRRFVLERIVPNQNITTESFHDMLQDLGSSVVQTWPYWSTEKWKEGAAPAASTAAAGREDARTTGGSPATQSRQVSTGTAVNDSKFQSAPQRR